MRLHLRVWGQVQGVYFRASTLEQASQRGLRGWVRNRADGSVEVVAEGDEAALRELLSWSGRGPPLARVEEVEAVWADEAGLEGFEVRPTL